MAYFSSQELASIKNDVAPKPVEPKGRGGFLTSLISEGGGILGGLAGIPLGPAGIAAGAAAGSTVGRGIENKIRNDQNFFGKGGSAKEALTEGAISGVASAGPLKLLKDAKNIVKPGAEATTNAAGNAGGSYLNKFTNKAGKRLTEIGSGLKADKNVGGVERLNEQADFMSKYTGTPRQQRVRMEADMKDLSGQVDAHLATTKTPVVGINMSSKLRSAIDDPNVFPDLDLTQPRAVKLLEKNMKIIGNKTDAQDANNFVKTINPTAVKARDKLSQGLPLTPNETAALATKRVIDEELTSIPEIAPLKKQMAQIFEVTPQVAKASEKGVGTSFLSGLTAKAPIQFAKGVASKTGALLQGATPTVAGEVAQPGARNLAARILAGRGVDNALQAANPAAPVEDVTQPSTEGQQALAVTAQDILDAEQGSQQDTDPYSPANIQAQVKNIIAQGGTQKDVAEFLSNAKSVGELSALSGKSNKPISATAADAIANAQAGLTSLDQIEQELAKNPSVQGKEAITQTFNPFGITGKVTGTSNYDTAITQAKDVIARLRTGAAISNSEETRFTKMLPQPADPPDTVRRKITLLRDALTTIVQRVGGNSQDLIQEAAANQ